MFSATFNNSLVISWWLVLLVEETGVLRENHRPQVTDKLYHIMMNIPYHNIVLFVWNKMTNSKHHTLNYIYIKFEDSKGIIRSHNPRRRDNTMAN